MPQFKSEFLHTLQERGFFNQCTNLEGLDALLAAQQSSSEPVTGYIGFDCTAPSLHVGTLFPIMLLHWFQKCGHRPIVLMGGGTTKVGDPSGKDASRTLLDDTGITSNLNSIKRVFTQFLQFEGSGGNAIMVNNDAWLSSLNYIHFLRDYGRHFSVNRMLSMDSVKLRLEREQELSFLEFNYMVLQAYDFVELYQRYGCRVQFGASDQWGNIINGVELHRRVMAEKNAGKQNLFDELFGYTTPLLTTASGAKMGKTASGAVWLNGDMLSPFEYWQFWRNTDDANVGNYLRLFTELPMDEVLKLAALQGAEINEAKKVLANEVTRLCHGAAAAVAAAETARKTFEEGTAGDNLKTVIIDKALLLEGIPAYELFCTVGLKDSKGEARKLIEGNGARLNDEKIMDPKLLITLAHMTPEGYIKLSAGKKNHVLVKV